MTTQHRIEVLKNKHKYLHSVIEASEAEKAPEEFIQKIKKEKLALKDEISRLEKDLT